MKKNCRLLYAAIMVVGLATSCNAGFFEIGQSIGTAIGQHVTDAVYGERGNVASKNDVVATDTTKDSNATDNKFKVPSFQKELFVSVPLDIDANGISENDIISNIVNFIASNSKYANMKYETSKNLIFDIWTTPKSEVVALYRDNKIYVSYKTYEITDTITLGGRSERRTQGPTIFSIPIDCEITKELNRFKVVLKSKEAAILETKRGIAPIDKSENLIFDTMSAVGSLQTMKIKKMTEVKGEINVAFNDASTYANFERILGLYTWTSNTKPSNIDITKDKYFKFNIQSEQNLPLHVKVYPYKNGSKVVYDLKVPYYLDMNGGISLAKLHLDAIAQQIEKVAND